MARASEIAKILDLYAAREHDLRLFMDAVAAHLSLHPSLRLTGRDVVHSCKTRLKDKDHLREKLMRKARRARRIPEETPITSKNFFDRITDLAGVRILHLYQDDFRYIDELIRKKVADGDWHLSETPRAYTWDPECKAFFGQFDLSIEQKETFYTSVHYLLRPRRDSPLCCEVQVRTLFEEIWGEVDHQLNYPVPTELSACQEQLRVLSNTNPHGSEPVSPVAQAD